MKFTFRLETLWKLRRSQREERERRLSEALRADEVLQTRLAETGVELAQTKEACRQASQPGAINVDELLITQRYELVLTAQREVLLGQRGQLAAEIDRRRQALVEADRQVKILDKLREKQQAEHHRREERLEVYRLDEIAGRRADQERVAW